MTILYSLSLMHAVMQLEPQNETAAQFYPLIQERIQLGNQRIEGEFFSRKIDHTLGVYHCSIQKLTLISHPFDFR